MNELTPWWQDPEWTQAIEGFQALRQAGQRTITFDLERLESAFYDPLIYDHVDQIIMEESGEMIEGRRYVPRLMAALFIRLFKVAGVPDKAQK